MYVKQVLIIHKSIKHFNFIKIQPENFSICDVIIYKGFYATINQMIPVHLHIFMWIEWVYLCSNLRGRQIGYKQQNNKTTHTAVAYTLNCDWKEFSE